MNQPQGPDTPDQYGVVGHPVSHSWSPFIHGMFAKATAQSLVYRLFDVAPDNFRREALRLFASGVRGLNVTLPHKQAAAELVNELTPRAERAQAVGSRASRVNWMNPFRSAPISPLSRSTRRRARWTFRDTSPSMTAATSSTR